MNCEFNGTKEDFIELHKYIHTFIKHFKLTPKTRIPQLILILKRVTSDMTKYSSFIDDLEKITPEKYKSDIIGCVERSIMGYITYLRDRKHQDNAQFQTIQHFEILHNAIVNEDNNLEKFNTLNNPFDIANFIQFYAMNYIYELFGLDYNDQDINMNNYKEKCSSRIREIHDIPNYRNGFTSFRDFMTTHPEYSTVDTVNAYIEYLNYKRNYYYQLYALLDYMLCYAYHMREFGKYLMSKTTHSKTINHRRKSNGGRKKNSTRKKRGGSKKRSRGNRKGKYGGSRRIKSSTDSNVVKTNSFLYFILNKKISPIAGNILVKIAGSVTYSTAIFFAANVIIAPYLSSGSTNGDPAELLRHSAEAVCGWVVTQGDTDVSPYKQIAETAGFTLAEFLAGNKLAENTCKAFGNMAVDNWETLIKMDIFDIVISGLLTGSRVGLLYGGIDSLRSLGRVWYNQMISDEPKKTAIPFSEQDRRWVDFFAERYPSGLKKTRVDLPRIKREITAIEDASNVDAANTLFQLMNIELELAKFNYYIINDKFIGKKKLEEFRIMFRYYALQQMSELFKEHVQQIYNDLTAIELVKKRTKKSARETVSADLKENISNMMQSIRDLEQFSLTEEEENVLLLKARSMVVSMVISQSNLYLQEELDKGGTVTMNKLMLEHNKSINYLEDVNKDPAFQGLSIVETTSQSMIKNMLLMALPTIYMEYQYFHILPKNHLQLLVSSSVGLIILYGNSQMMKKTGTTVVTLLINIISLIMMIIVFYNFVEACGYKIDTEDQIIQKYADQNAKYREYTQNVTYNPSLNVSGGFNSVIDMFDEWVGKDPLTAMESYVNETNRIREMQRNSTLEYGEYKKSLETCNKTPIYCSPSWTTQQMNTTTAWFWAYIYYNFYDMLRSLLLIYPITPYFSASYIWKNSKLLVIQCYAVVNFLVINGGTSLSLPMMKYASNQIAHNFTKLTTFHKQAVEVIEDELSKPEYVFSIDDINRKIRGFKEKGGSEFIINQMKQIENSYHSLNRSLEQRAEEASFRITLMEAEMKAQQVLLQSEQLAVQKDQLALQAKNVEIQQGMLNVQQQGLSMNQDETLRRQQELGTSQEQLDVIRENTGMKQSLIKEKEKDITLSEEMIKTLYKVEEKMETEQDEKMRNILDRFWKLNGYEGLENSVQKIEEKEKDITLREEMIKTLYKVEEKMETEQDEKMRNILDRFWKLNGYEGLENSVQKIEEVGSGAGGGYPTSGAGGGRIISPSRIISTAFNLAFRRESRLEEGELRESPEEEGEIIEY